MDEESKQYLVRIKELYEELKDDCYRKESMIGHLKEELEKSREENSALRAWVNDLQKESEEYRKLAEDKHNDVLYAYKDYKKKCEELEKEKEELEKRNNNQASILWGREKYGFPLPNDFINHSISTSVGAAVISAPVSDLNIDLDSDFDSDLDSEELNSPD